ncbi:MAG TPA: hypothetical protein VJ276_09810 [Thermoanaerobaculia bacterium]|nr:hypothetical protein [Thermoanaerobaculia bacterium]
MKRFVFTLLMLGATAAFAAPEAQPNGMVTPLGAATQVVIPAAGAVAGANGVFFRSDITLFNYATHPQRVRLFWLPAGQDGRSIAPRELTIPARAAIASEDFVGNFMLQTGLGAILVQPVTDLGALDLSAQLRATARIYSNVPGQEAGTVSQSFDTIPLTAADQFRLTIVGAKHDERFRMNVGVVNLEQTAQSFSITFVGTAGGQGPDVVNITVPPMSLVQVPAPNTAHVNLQVAVQNTSTPQAAKWTAYGSSVDNVSGDSWSELGFVQP